MTLSLRTTDRNVSRNSQLWPLLVEILEDRALPTCVLGAGASIDGTTGTLTILGTNKSDTIDIQRVDPGTPAIPTDDSLVATVQGKQVASCAITDVQKLFIDGGN